MGRTETDGLMVEDVVIIFAIAALRITSEDVC